MAREAANFRQAFIQLPAELRNQIYELVIPSGQEIAKRHVHPKSRGWQGQLPSLLHVCRRMRKEVFPIFYGTNLITIELEHLMLHPSAVPRIRSCVNLLPVDGTTCWRVMRIEKSSRCFHPDGAKFTTIVARIDRSEGTISCQPRAFRPLPCCQTAAKECSVRLSKEIKSRGLHDSKHKLRAKDFERLSLRMDESRADWPKSPRRVIPKRFPMAPVERNWVWEKLG